MNHSAKPFPDALVEAVRHQRLVPFVGSLVSAVAQDKHGVGLLPDWRQFFACAVEELGRLGRDGEVRLLARLLEKRQPDWYQAAITARSAMTTAAWHQFLYRRLNPSFEMVDPASLAAARALWALGSRMLITTNVDRVLSWSCPQSEDLGRWMKTPSDFLLNNPPEKPIIWHLHGFIDDPESLLLTPGGRRLHPDEAGAPTRYRAALATLQHLLSQRTFLFVGFGEEDPYFISMLQRVNELFHQCGGPHYALVPERACPMFKARLGSLPVELIACQSVGENLLTALVEEAQMPGHGDKTIGFGLEDDVTQAPTIALGEKNADAGGTIELPGRYQIRHKLGQGGMGMVYRAHDRQLDREVAVKVILPSLMSPEADQRFGLEARAIAKLDHPAIVPVYDYGRHQDTVYLTMPLVEGKLLRKLMSEPTVTLAQKLEICAQLADALDYSHGRGVFHCDIKPENVMVLGGEDRYRVRVMDFGLARLATRKRIGQPGDVVGTPLYLSPEQCTSKDLDGRTDLYALGTILYEFLAGETPFKGTFHSLIYKIVHERPPLLLSRGVEIDEELESLVLQCLAKKPENRPQRGRELGGALRAYLNRRGNRGSGSFQLMLPESSGPSMVGREEELSELHLRLDATLAGVCQFAVIGGESGMGKTRLMRELEKIGRENSEPFQVWWGRFPEQESTMPFQAFNELVTSYFAQRNDGDPMPDLTDLAADLVSLMPALAEIGPIRAAADTVSFLKQDEGRDQRFVYDLMARTIRRLAGDQPTMLLLENLHNAGASLDALDYLVHRLGATPTLIVAGYRGGLAKNHPLYRFLRGYRGDRRFLSLELTALDDTRHRRLVTSLLGGDEASEDLLDKLLETSEGNPYFTAELVRSLRERGAILRDEKGLWVFSDQAAIHDDALPRTIKGTVEERIRHLPETVRDTLATAAILGRRFSFEDLKALDAHPEALDDALDLLIYEGILGEDARARGNAFSFQSKVVCDVLYQRFSRRKRRSLHQRYARHLEATFSGKLERIYARLVHHFAEGDDPDKTVHYAILLAERSLETFAPEEAVRSVEVALSFVRDEGYEGGALVEGRLCQLLSRARLGMGHLELALSEAGEGVRAFKRGNDAKGAATAALLAAETAWRLHKVATTRRWVENGIALARSVDEHGVLHHLLTLAAKVANLSRNYEYARVCLKEAELIAPPNIRESITGPIPFGGRLLAAVRRPIAQLQPGRIQLAEELEFAATVFETLLQTDVEGNLVELLAVSWESLNWSRSFRFRLHQGVVFSDGVVLEASHVKRSFELAATSSAGTSAPSLTAIEGFEALCAGERDDLAGIVVEDRFTLRFDLLRPLPIFPSLLTDRANASIFRIGQDGLRLLGTGPFYIERHEAGELVLSRNKHYWRKTLSTLEQLICRHCNNTDEMVSELRIGSLDMGRDLSADQVESLLRLPRFQRGLVECTRKSVGFLLFNKNSSHLQKPGVRRILMSALRVRDLVWNALGRMARPATCLIPPGVLGHDPGRRIWTQKGRELQLFQELGMEPPIRLKAAIHPLITERYGPLLAGIFREWMTLGVEVEVVPAASKALVSDDFIKPETDLLITRFRAQYDDPDAFTYQLFHTRHGSFGGWCGDLHRDRVMEEARSTAGSEDRILSYRNLESELLEEGLLLPLFYDIDCRVACTRLKGVTLSPNAPFLNYTEMGKVPSREPTVPAGVVRIPITGKLEHLDPAHMNTYDYGEVVPNIFETLTRVGDGAHVEPCLASFHTDDGGRRYSFQLRDNVYFHDGRGLTSRDVRYTFERVIRESSLHGQLLHCIRGAQAFRMGKSRDIAGLRLVSHNQFTIELEKPLSFFPGMLTHPALGILPEGAALEGAFCRNYIGTGPFRLGRFQPGILELEANLQYWNKGFPRCGRLEFYTGMNPSKVAKSFRDGSLSMAAGIYPSEAESLRSKGGYRQEEPETPGLSTYFLVFNTHEGVFADREARRVFAQALNVGRSVKDTLQGMCLEAGGFIPPGLAGREAQSRSLDLDNIRTIPPGFRIRAAVHPFFFRQFVRFWERITGDLDPLGIKLQVVHRDVISSLDALPGPLDLVAYRWFADYPDADTFVKLLHSGQGLFGSMVGNRHIDLLIEKGRIETDEALRGEIYAEIEEIIAKEMLLLPLFHETNYRLGRPELRGLRTRIGFPIVAYDRLSIKEVPEGT